MCFREGELIVGGQDVLLGHIGGCPLYMHAQQYEYWRHTQVVVDVGRAGERFFPGRPGQMHFLPLARVFLEDEEAGQA